MKKYLTITLLTLLPVVIIGSCEKNTPSTPVVPQAKCIIKSSVSLLAANYAHNEFEFDNTGKPTFIKGYRPNGSIVSEIEFGSNTVVYYKHDAQGRRPWYIMKFSAVFAQYPTKVDISLWVDDTLKVNYYTYFFFYGGDDKIIKVGMQTNHVVGDWEYDLNIFYNEQGNVKTLQYVTTTGSTQVLAPITVAAYDDKPSPYTGIKDWRFLCNWNSSDPEPILTALSKNNPLDYTLGEPGSLFKREMVYKYNSEGFPTERKNTNRNVNGEYTFLETYTYNCN
jgi:hypothetical protein